jgi:anti-sigma factor RsiW
MYDHNDLALARVHMPATPSSPRQIQPTSSASTTTSRRPLVPRVLFALAVVAASYIPAASAFALSGNNHSEALLLDD